MVCQNPKNALRPTPARYLAASTRCLSVGQLSAIWRLIGHTLYPKSTLPINDNLGHFHGSGFITVKFFGDAQVMLAGNFEGVAQPRNNDVEGKLHGEFRFPAFSGSVEWRLVDNASGIEDLFDLDVQVVPIDAVAGAWRAGRGILEPHAEQVAKPGRVVSQFDGADTFSPLGCCVLNPRIDGDAVLIPQHVPPLELSSLIPAQSRPSRQSEQGAVSVVGTGFKDGAHVAGGELVPVAIGGWGIAGQIGEGVFGNQRCFDSGVEDGLNGADIFADVRNPWPVTAVLVVEREFAAGHSGVPFGRVPRRDVVDSGIVIEMPGEVLSGHDINQAGSGTEILNQFAVPCQPFGEQGDVRGGFDLPLFHIHRQLPTHRVGAAFGDFGSCAERLSDATALLGRVPPPREPVIAVAFQPNINVGHGGMVARRQQIVNGTIIKIENSPSEANCGTSHGDQELAQNEGAESPAPERNPERKSPLPTPSETKS